MNYTLLQNTTFNCNCTVLTDEQIHKTPELAYYYENLYIGNVSKDFTTYKMQTNQTTLLMDDCDIYVNNNKEIVSCMFYDGLDNAMLFMVIVLPIFYVFITIFLIIYYCKYRKIHSQYQVLKGEAEDGHNNPQVELENQAPKV